MKAWAKALDRRVKDYDSALYIQESPNDRYDVLRRSKYGEAPPHLIFSLTDTWQPTGRPVQWGSEVVINRIKAHDLWRDDQWIENYIKQEEKDKESKDRAMQNSIESFLYEFRRQFAKATDGINTSTLNKVYREEKAHGYR